jgi:uncharacterized RDD family membrane protein YckC
MSQTLFPHPNPDWLLTRGVLSRRFMALILDCILISIFGWGMAIFIAVFGFFTLGLGWLAFHIIPWLPLFYFTLLVGNGGATLGQRAFGLMVRQDADLSPPNMAQALVWTLLLWLSFVLACIPFLLALSGPRHRAAHDLLSGLVIVRQPQISY